MNLSGMVRLESDEILFKGKLWNDQRKIKIGQTDFVYPFQI